MSLTPADLRVDREIDAIGEFLDRGIEQLDQRTKTTAPINASRFQPESSPSIPGAHRRCGEQGILWAGGWRLTAFCARATEE